MVYELVLVYCTILHGLSKVCLSVLASECCLSKLMMSSWVWIGWSITVQYADSLATEVALVFLWRSAESVDSVLLQFFCSIADIPEEQLSELPPEIQSLLHSYSHLFEPPTHLPPSRACNHTIPLVPGSKPVALRPYRYPPKLKDELETQVHEMLKQGIIQPSASLFSSPVMLVPKKDGSYRFCVDFRHLNAITLKSKFPIPVFDQLMDELAHA